MTADSADGTPREVNRLVFDTAADANRYLVAAHTKAELIELVIAQTNAAAAAQTRVGKANGLRERLPAAYRDSPAAGKKQ